MVALLGIFYVHIPSGTGYKSHLDKLVYFNLAPGFRIQDETPKVTAPSLRLSHSTTTYYLVILPGVSLIVIAIMYHLAPTLNSFIIRRYESVFLLLMP
jgi:hypothetical protein